MTTRDFFETVATLDNAELAAYATEALAKLDKTNATRAAKNAEKTAEKHAADAELIAKLLACVDDTPKTAMMLLDESGLDATPQKVSYLLRPFINEGTVLKDKVAVPDKKTKITAYKRA